MIEWTKDVVDNIREQKDKPNSNSMTFWQSLDDGDPALEYYNNTTKENRRWFREAIFNIFEFDRPIPEPVVKDFVKIEWNGNVKYIEYGGLVDNATPIGITGMGQYRVNEQGYYDILNALKKQLWKNTTNDD